MSEISRGTTRTVALPAGYLLEVTGSAEVYVSVSQITNVQSFGRFGPYSVDTNLNVRAVGGVVSYISYNPSLHREMTPIVYGSGIPFVMPASGTINSTSGSITTGTAHDYAVGPSYSYFPANALSASSPAGWYYTNWTAATLGTVYADVYTNGVPQIPPAPQPLTTVAGAYTQVTGFDAIGPSYIVPGGFMDDNGCIEWQRVANNNNSAGAKTFNTYFGGSLIQGFAQTANPKEAGMGTIKNRGRQSAQISANAAHGDSGNASTLPKSSIDTSAAQIFAFALQLATATDYAMIESHFVRINSIQ